MDPAQIERTQRPKPERLTEARAQLATIEDTLWTLAQEQERLLSAPGLNHAALDVVEADIQRLTREAAHQSRRLAILEKELSANP